MKCQVKTKVSSLPRALALALSLSVLALGVGEAQERPRAQPRAQAPTWKVGDWWELSVTRERVELFPGPRVRPTVAPLSGLTSLGPRPGYFEEARWRLVVERFQWLDAGEGVPTPGWFVGATQLDGPSGACSFVLVFVGEEKALSDIGVRRPGQQHPRYSHFDADAHDRAPHALDLAGLPLAWPDLRAPDPKRSPALKGCYEAQRLQQRQRQDEAGRWYQLRQSAPSPGYVVTIRWRPGEPWWAEARGPGYEVKLLRTSADAREAEGAWAGEQPQDGAPESGAPESGAPESGAPEQD